MDCNRSCVGRTLLSAFLCGPLCPLWFTLLIFTTEDAEEHRGNLHVDGSRSSARHPADCREGILRLRSGQALHSQVGAGRPHDSRRGRRRYFPRRAAAISTSKYLSSQLISPCILLSTNKISIDIRLTRAALSSPAVQRHIAAERRQLWPPHLPILRNR